MEANSWASDKLFSSKSNDWSTPDWLVSMVEEEYGPIELDVSASDSNNKSLVYFTEDDDTIGNGYDWRTMYKRKLRDLRMVSELRGNIWCNPPYGRDIGKWMEMCVHESFEPRFYVRRAGTYKDVFCLVFARTDTKWFHEWVVPYAHKVFFIKARLQFTNADGRTGPAPAPSMLVHYNGSNADPCKFATISKDGFHDPHND
tara:strand:+ start:2048 stop:2650 length:603 start_codon:yes stop_codon:yes gene_type:complete